MDFFKSVFSEDPEPSTDLHSQPEEDTSKEEPLHEETDTKNPNFSPKSPPMTSWSFGGLIKTFASKSESVLQNYKKDFEEFSSELKKETSVIREVASKAVKDLPTSLEVGASVAQESLESVGQVIDDLGTTVWRGTTGIITHGKDVLLSVDQESDSSDSQGYTSSSMSMNSRRYSRFDSQVLAFQNDISTYSEEPEDLDEFNKWKIGFVLGEKDEEIGDLLSDNGVMDSVYRKLVPKSIDDETFWTRYFYKVYKLKQVEEARANLVKRAISSADEDLSWDVDDDEEEETNVSISKGETTSEINLSEKKVPEESSDVDARKIDDKNTGSELGGGKLVLQSEGGDGVTEETTLEEKVDHSVLSSQNLIEKSEDKSVLDGKSEQAESCKDSDVSVVSSQPSFPEEQDLSWDEIEDISGIDEKKVSVSDSPNRADLRKRLSVAEEEEDLSWDIEDDD